jgi:DNA-directed RNA polymerase specialized sigma24 family protein
MELESSTLKSTRELTSLALITLIITGSEETYANKLKEEFFVRYRQKIYDYCLYIANKNFGHSSDWKSVCEDVIQETFLFALYNLGEFKFEKSWSESKLNGKAIAWLGAIAEHKLLDHYNHDRGTEEEVAAFQYDLKKKLGRIKTVNKKDTYVLERPVLEEAMKQLKERDKDVLYKYLEHGCLHGTKHLPDDIMSALCTKWDITPGNARQIKGRAFDQLKKLCIQQTTIST